MYAALVVRVGMHQLRLVLSVHAFFILQAKHQKETSSFSGEVQCFFGASLLHSLLLSIYLPLPSGF